MNTLPHISIIKYHYVLHARSLRQIGQYMHMIGTQYTMYKHDWGALTFLILSHVGVDFWYHWYFGNNRKTKLIIIIFIL